jgi:hypothetical protein
MNDRQPPFPAANSGSSARLALNRFRLVSLIALILLSVARCTTHRCNAAGYIGQTDRFRRCRISPDYTASAAI